ncbi:MAG TPA: hypothetical protein VF572_03020 [Candidatus Saccharimonadales bacterium]|jgi:hypothetical protein
MTKALNTPLQRLRPRQSGSLVVSILIVTVFLFTVVTGLIVLANSNLSRAKGRIFLLQSQYAAESGADQAIAKLNADNLAAYTGTGGAETTILSNAQYRSTFSTVVAAGANSNERSITSVGKVYRPATATTATFTHTIQVTAQRTSSTVTVAGMLSRNIIEIASSVKDIYARDLYVNGYINMNKNTTKLFAESITVAGKNTGAANCSIGGTGNLVKPTTFNTPGQTRTKIRTAYNNCISPPGNSSNTNFEILANQNTLGKIQSTYIPWSQYMDNTYQNSSTGCADWTGGAFPRTIPSAGNTKRTHYPDSGSNVSTSCGTSGNLALGTGQYNITDTVHIRANLCGAAACTPTFYNPTSTPRYIFVEGTVNFDGVNTAAGSGPVILIAYGADPAAKMSVCPLGGAMYIGNGTANAPNMYFLAINGLCFDKTKFGANPSFGGFSGKNIYISSSPGSPFDPQLNTSFPFDSVPIDLSWHASRYRRVL